MYQGNEVLQEAKLSEHFNRSLSLEKCKGPQNTDVPPLHNTQCQITKKDQQEHAKQKLDIMEDK